MPTRRVVTRSISQARGVATAVLVLLAPAVAAAAAEPVLVVDDRSRGDRTASSGGEWRLITDGVMGGASDGDLSAVTVRGRRCLRLQGRVRLDNNGGFIQAALDWPRGALPDIRDYTGVALTVAGNGESYSVHLRTRDNRLPWQSYRATFSAGPEWTEVRLPFDAFTPYRTDAALDVGRLERIGIVAIGREFRAELCVAMVGIYR